jgi:hypothetical protein
VPFLQGEGHVRGLAPRVSIYSDACIRCRRRQAVTPMARAAGTYDITTHARCSIRTLHLVPVQLERRVHAGGGLRVQRPVARRQLHAAGPGAFACMCMMYTHRQARVHAGPGRGYAVNLGILTYPLGVCWIGALH